MLFSEKAFVLKKEIYMIGFDKKTEALQGNINSNYLFETLKEF